jgi:hypothetical protein
MKRRKKKRLATKLNSTLKRLYTMMKLASFQACDDVLTHANQ